MGWSKDDKELKTRISQIELKTRSMVSHMAVNCRVILDDIESIHKWDKNPRIVEWHQLLKITQQVLLNKPVNREPAEAPPDGIDVSDIDAQSGSAGGGEGSCGGNDAPTAAIHFLPWDDVCGAK